MGHVPWQAVSHGQRLIGQTGREWFGCSILLQWVSKLRMSSLWIHSLRGQMWPMHVYIYTHAYIHTYLPTYLHTYIHIYIHTYIHTYIRTYVSTYVRTYVLTYVRTYIRTYVHTYIRTYVHTYIRTYVHTYMYIVYIYIYTGNPLLLPAPTFTTCPNIKKHCVLWDKMRMSMIMAFILQRTA